MELGWGVAPQMPDFLQHFPFFRFVCFPFHPMPIFCLFCLRVVVVVIILFLKTNHIWSCFFCRHRHQGRGRGRHKHATGRPCARGRLGSKHQLCPVKPGAALKRGRSPSSAQHTTLTTQAFAIWKRFWQESSKLMSSLEGACQERQLLPPPIS